MRPLADKQHQDSPPPIDTTEPAPSDTTEPEEPDAFACVDDAYDDEMPLTVENRTNGKGNEMSPSCAPNDGGEDYVVSWTAPERGDYVFDLAGSSYDTTLMVADSCTGEELACNDDWLPGGISQVVASLRADQEVIVVVDGRRNQAGNFVLNVDALQSHENDCADGRDLDADGLVDCDDEDCAGEPACIPTLACVDGILQPPFPISVSGTTEGNGNQTTPPCGTAGNAPDLALQFTAPSDGSYVVSTAGSGFDTILYVYDGCGGAVLSCNDDIGGGTLQSELTVPLAAGETVVIVIDGYNNASGAVSLSVDRN